MVDALDPEGTEIRVLNSLSRLRGRDVLEIGTGNGRLTWRYAERVASVVGLEPDEGRVARARAATPPRCAIVSIFGVWTSRQPICLRQHSTSRCFRGPYDESRRRTSCTS